MENSTPTLTSTQFQKIYTPYTENTTQITDTRSTIDII